MNLNRDSILEILIKQSIMGEGERGVQPTRTLDCFYDLKVEDDFFCKSCQSYQTCKTYLQYFEISLRKDEGR